MERFIPKFWNYKEESSHGREPSINFGKIWKLTIFLTAGVTLIPLITLAVVDFQVSLKSFESEHMLRTARLVSNTNRSIEAFFFNRRSALDFVAKEYDLEKLGHPDVLENVYQNLKISFGSITDIGIIDQNGIQINYVGPYALLGKNYRNQDWYLEVDSRGVFISDVFLGFRKVPHLVIAIKRTLPDGSFYILRTTLDTSVLDSLLSGIEIAGKGDIFIVNQQGVLQTPSIYHGKVLEQWVHPVPEFASKTRVLKSTENGRKEIIVGYRYITETPFILVVVKNQKELLKSWHQSYSELLLFLSASIILILGVIIGMATFLVNKIYMADHVRNSAIHEMEFNNKMATIGRLAAGVAHEVNNPLAIINEKAGLIKDLFTFKKEYNADEKLIGLLDSILKSVKRAGTITKRLLSFARHAEVQIQLINLENLVNEVLGFLYKEAEYRSISIHVNVIGEIPMIESDYGKIQEIFLNLFTNAFAAMDNGGHLVIQIENAEKEQVRITVEDDGCGIPEANLEKIFEPFFSTKTKKGGTGLGLSLTYNFVVELGGYIHVESELGKGTIFTVILPVLMEKKEGNPYANIVDR